MESRQRTVLTGCCQAESETELGKERSWYENDLVHGEPHLILGNGRDLTGIMRVLWTLTFSFLYLARTDRLRIDA